MGKWEVPIVRHVVRDGAHVFQLKFRTETGGRNARGLPITPVDAGLRAQIDSKLHYERATENPPSPARAQSEISRTLL